MKTEAKRTDGRHHTRYSADQLPAVRSMCTTMARVSHLSSRATEDTNLTSCSILVRGTSSTDPHLFCFFAEVLL